MENRTGKTGKSMKKGIQRRRWILFLLGFSCFLVFFRSDFPYKTRFFPWIFMDSTPIFKVRPDPKESFSGEYGRLIRYLIGRLRPGVLFYYRSVFDFQMMALIVIASSLKKHEDR